MIEHTDAARESRARDTDLSSSQPYAFGVSLMTVCRGILMYGRSACLKLWKYAYLVLVCQRREVQNVFWYAQTSEDGLMSAYVSYGCFQGCEEIVPGAR